MNNISCSDCGKEVAGSSKTGRCQACYLKNNRGRNNPGWKGGKSKTGGGYKLIRAVNHPFAKGNGYVLEHRLVMEKHIGRYLKPEEVVHHINHNKTDNRVENLIITNSSEHAGKLHPQVKGICTICQKPQLARGFCKSHYWSEYLQEARRNSDYYIRRKERKHLKSPAIK